MGLGYQVGLKIFTPFYIGNSILQGFQATFEQATTSREDCL